MIDRALAWLTADRRTVHVVDSEKPTVTFCRLRDEICVLAADTGGTVDGRDVVSGRTLPVAGLFA